MTHGTSAVPYSAAPHTELPRSPFDGIRHEDERGEYWTGRGLMPLMGYGRWHEFEAVIEKAKASLALVEGDAQAAHHFVVQHSDGGRWGNQQLADCRLTRFGAYLTAMAGDDTKQAVAEARVYFAVRTREAEVRPALPQDLPTALRAWADEVEARERAELERQQAWAEATRVRAIAADQEEQIRRDAPKVGYVENFVQPADDACTMLVLANELGCGVRWLYGFLKRTRRIYKDRYDQYQPYSDWKKWFTVRDQPDAPRLHNGQLRTTLYVTPVGKEGIRRMVERETDA